MQISFLDADADEKKITKNVEVMKRNGNSSTAGFEFILAMAGISLAAYLTTNWFTEYQRNS